MNTNSELRAIIENLAKSLSTDKAPCKVGHINFTFSCVDGDWGWGLVVNASKNRPRFNGWGETPAKAIDDLRSAPAFGRWA